MIKKQILKSTFISLFSLFVIAFMGCSQVLSPENEETSQSVQSEESSQALASLTISIGDSSARTAAPTVNFRNDIKTITLTGTYDSDTSITTTKTWNSVSEAQNATITGLKLGAWTFTLSCRLESGIECLRQENVKQTLTEGSNKITFTLEEVGNGTLNLSIALSDFDGAETASKFDIYFYKLNATSEKKYSDITIAKGSTASYTLTDVEHGMYIVKATAKKSDGTEITSIMELVKIVTGYSTTCNITFSNFATSYTITYDTTTCQWKTGQSPVSEHLSYTKYDDVTLADGVKLNSPYADAGYEFAGWYDNSGYTGSPITGWDNGRTGNVTIYAKWIYKSNVQNVNGTSGNDETGDGSSDKPFKTVQKAISKIKDISPAGTNHIDGPYTINVTGEIEASDDGTVANFTGLNGVEITVDGGSSKATLKGNKSITNPSTIKNSVVVVDASSLNLTLKNLTIKEGESTNGGGINICGGNVTVQNSTINGNKAENGGGIYNAGTLTMESCTVNCNFASKNGNSNGLGGGIYVVDGSTTTLNGCVIGDKDATSVPNSTSYSTSGNCAENGGGGIYVSSSSSTATVILKDNCIVAKNYSGGSGGGICTNADVKNKKIQIENSILKYNYAVKNGGAINAYGQDNSSTPYPNNYIKSTQIIGNQAGENGGGISIVNNSYFGLINCNQISDNTATGKGNGIYSNGTLRLYGNISIDSGNDIYLCKEKTIYLASGFSTSGNITITPNSSSEFGTAILSAETSELIANNIGNFNITGSYILEQPSATSKSAVLAPKNVCYVDSSFTGTSLGTKSSPYKTIQEAIGKITTENNAITDDSARSEYVIYVTGEFVGDGTNPLVSLDSSCTKNLNLSIIGETAQATLKGNGKRVVFIDNNSVKFTVKLQNLKITEGNSASGAGINFNGNADSTLDIVNCVITENTATSSNGGGIYLYRGAATISGTEISNNTADNFGSGIFNGGILTLSGTTKISDNDIYFAADSTINVANDFATTTAISLSLKDTYYSGSTPPQILTGAVSTNDNYKKFTVKDGWTIDSEGKLQKAKTEIVYLNSSSGNDNNSGSSADKPVASLKHALEMLDTSKTTPTIVVMSPYTIASGEKDLLDFSTYTNRPTIKRYYESSSKNNDGDIFVIGSSVTANIANVIIDGSRVIDGGGTFESTSLSSSSLLKVSGNVKIGNNVNLQNNYSSSGGAIYVGNGSTAEFVGSNIVISGNKAISGSAICNAGKAIVQNCTFSSNEVDNWGTTIDNLSDVEFSIKNCTFSGNKSGSSILAAIYNAGNITLTLSGTITTDSFNFISFAVSVLPTLTINDDFTLALPSYTDADLEQTIVTGSKLTQDICDKIKLSNSEYRILFNSPNGVLAKLPVSGSGIQIELPGLTGYTATLSPSSPTFGGSVTLTLTKGGSSVAPSSCEMELYTPDDLATPITKSSATSLTIPSWLSAAGNKNFKVRIVAYVDGLLILDGYYDITVQ